MIWIQKGQLRIESRVIEETGIGDLNVIITSDKMAYTWWEGDSRGQVSTQGQKGIQDTFQGFENVSCSPWWLPSDSAFVPPVLVDFEQSS